MKFYVGDNYDKIENNIPEEAKQEKYTKIDVRNASAPELIPFYNGKSTDWWYNEGTNHRVEDYLVYDFTISQQVVKPCIMRDYEEFGWFVEFETLEQLMNFLKNYPNAIVSCTSRVNKNIPSINIQGCQCD